MAAVLLNSRSQTRPRSQAQPRPPAISVHHFAGQRFYRPDISHALTDLEYRLLLVARAAHAAGESPSVAELSRRAGFTNDRNLKQRRVLHRLGLWPLAETIPAPAKPRAKRAIVERATTAVVSATTIEAERAAVKARAAEIRARETDHLRRDEKDDEMRPFLYRRAHAPERAVRGPTLAETVAGYRAEFRRIRRRGKAEGRPS